MLIFKTVLVMVLVFVINSTIFEIVSAVMNKKGANLIGNNILIATLIGLLYYL